MRSSAEDPTDSLVGRLKHLEEEEDWAGYFGAVRDATRHAELPFSLLNAVFNVGKKVQKTGEPEGFKPLRLGIVRNVTVEPWLPALFSHLLGQGFFTEFWVGDFDVFEDYALDPDSRLYEVGPDVLWIVMDFRAFVGDAFFSPPPDAERALLDRVVTAVDGLRERLDGHLILPNFAQPPHDYFMPLSHQRRGGWTHARRAMNLALVERYEDDGRVYAFDLDGLVARWGVDQAYDTRGWHTARTPFAVDFLSTLADGLARVVRAVYYSPKKCLVLDCDNTLWGGVLGEDGPTGVQIGMEYPGSAFREFQQYLKALQSRGTLLTLNSKNNHQDVVSFIDDSPDMVLNMEDFTSVRINWSDKVSNLRELAEEINIGLDSMIFIDDSEVECELVSSFLPEVQVERFPLDPLAIPDFIASIRGLETLAVTDDDLKRSATYKANVKRERLRQESPDLDGFIRSLDIDLHIGKRDVSVVPRVSQLTMRTNQFNLTTNRYATEQIEKFLEDGEVYWMRMTDRFSDYGVIGAAIVRFPAGGTPEIDTFLMSCRAFGREIETEFLSVILWDLARMGHEEVRAFFRPTEKNAMVRDFFPSNGFEVAGETGGLLTFSRKIADGGVRMEDPRFSVRLSGF